MGASSAGVQESGFADVKGDHSSKVYELVKQILTIRHNDPDAKILVFSSVCLNRNQF